MSSHSTHRSHHRGRQPRSHYYDDDYSDDYYEPEPRPRHRSLGRAAMDKIESAVAGLGLDSSNSDNSKALTRRRDSETRYYSPDRAPRSHKSHHSSRRTYSASPDTRRRRTRRDSDWGGRSSERSRSRWNHSLEAAIDAAAMEAFRLRKEPGPWTGAKGSRVATAAISAAAIGAADNKNSKREKGKLGSVGAAVGGLVVNRLVNGPRRDVR
ncbi:hypothetical protein B0H66DRAFT_388007 [Apodospora peruviana]|uniref:Uncharacterized protein n=1 Tax=Apodospora peruviana TaxID=516989 RepID=A0AAE0LZC9_9PEZI|nr:hypothetical protein B0H66DRAFT_388007 [Apodospora peruviana]